MNSLVLRHVRMFLVCIVYHRRVPFRTHMPGHQIFSCICLVFAAGLSLLGRNVRIAIDSRYGLFNLLLERLLNMGGVGILFLNQLFLR
ncbi:hypothetical protein D3C74_475600 [compost metagenome]